MTYQELSFTFYKEVKDIMPEIAKFEDYDAGETLTEAIYALDNYEWRASKTTDLITTIAHGRTKATIYNVSDIRIGGATARSDTFIKAALIFLITKKREEKK
jgi:uncharacterized protein CbrC (UPF0167 family)